LFEIGRSLQNVRHRDIFIQIHQVCLFWVRDGSCEGVSLTTALKSCGGLNKSVTQWKCNRTEGGEEEEEAVSRSHGAPLSRWSFLRVLLVSPWSGCTRSPFPSPLHHLPPPPSPPTTYIYSAPALSISYSLPPPNGQHADHSKGKTIHRVR
jgi:hypothetical protein